MDTASVPSLQHTTAFGALTPNSGELVATRPTPVPAWPLWQRVLFRFFFVYLVLQIEPWNWLRVIPGARFVLQPYFRLMDWAVRVSNARIFHIRDTLVLPNGSGDTSWAYAQLCLFLAVAGVGAVVWSVLDRNRPSYRRLAWWLRMFVR
ncbi:MAG TPA: hypothetical protein VH277_01480, partial [Gemmatimonadaceae bacterium]|nr:hypothetical protein [Gemmatimonadaceae bacterium]